MFSDLFHKTGLSGVMLVMLVLFSGCSKDEDTAASSASLAATTVNCNATSNRIITRGPAGMAYAATLAFDGGEKWCSFESNTTVAAGVVGQDLPLVLEVNTSDQYRTAEITVTFANGYSTLLQMWQMPATSSPEAADYQRSWGEQPAYRQGTNYIYKTYHTTLVSTNKYLMGGVRRNYSICFDASNRVSLWVAYPLHGCYTTPRASRSDAWSYDPNAQLPVIEQSQQANIAGPWSFYQRGARGHQCPSADRYNSDATNAMTFYATNIMPQNSQFNGGSWSSLESKIRDWAPKSVNEMRYDTLFVVSGAHLVQGQYTYDRDGKKVAYPDKCWKVLLKQKRGQNENRQIWEFSADELQAVGFIFTNDRAGGQTKLLDAACTVKEVEQLTGFTFFRNLDPAVADEVKSREPDATQWPGLAIN